MGVETRRSSRPRKIVIEGSPAVGFFMPLLPVCWLLSVGVPPNASVDESVGRLNEKLREAVKYGWVAVSTEEATIVVRIKAAEALDPVDRRWHTLGTIAVESQEGGVPMRIEIVVGPSSEGWEQQLGACSRNLEGAASYFYKKRGLDRRKVTVIGHCTVGG